MKSKDTIFFWVIDLVVSIGIGILAGYLFSIGDVPNIVISSWIAFAVSLASLLILPALIAVDPSSCENCKRNYSAGLVLGAAGTLVLSLAALSIQLNPAFLSVVILVGLGAAFFTFTLIALIAYLLCLTR